MGGGGGRPSDALGELELFRTSALSEGENIGRWGKVEFIDGCVHDCGMALEMENGWIPVADGDQYVLGV